MRSSSRRSFLARCSSVAAAAAIPPFYLWTSDKSGQRLPTVGSGAHTYECVHDWLIPPDGLVWGDTHGLAQDEQGRIYVAHTVNKSSTRGESIVVYDADGRFVSAFGEEFRGGAHGLGIRREAAGEFLYHCDINRCKIVKTTPDGRTVWMVCPDLDSQVCIFDSEYNVIAQLGDGQAANGEVGSRRGQSRREFTPGQFITPHAAIFLRNGNILVAEWLPIGRITLLRRV
jgi:hypothetical protein